MFPLIQTFDFSGNAEDIFSLFQNEPYLFLLDSSLSEHECGRYSFLGFDPFQIVHSRQDREGLARVREQYRPFYQPALNEISPFTAGIVGFLSYDYGLERQPVRNKTQKEVSLPDCYFGFYDRVVTIDHRAGKIHVSSTGWPLTDQPARQERARQRLEYAAKKITDFLASGQGNPITKEPFTDDSDGQALLFERLKSNFSRNKYMTAVQKSLDYIAAGDIYQVNLSQRFMLDISDQKMDPVDLYKSLRQIGPAPFGAYLKGPDFFLLSHSPERFLWKQGSVCRTRPMKGTRPRGRDSGQDSRLRDELLASEKDKAELLMIVDLERNDLGRVCDYGSVYVKQQRLLETYETVFQTVAVVEGRVRPDKDCFDILEDCFPGGSITGCPKIRAMEVIEELETVPRSVYTGSLGYISFSGNMDFNILIRTMSLFCDTISFHVGGGIVADSIPEEEYEETLVKAKGMLRCLHRGLETPVNSHYV